MSRSTSFICLCAFFKCIQWSGVFFGVYIWSSAFLIERSSTLVMIKKNCFVVYCYFKIMTKSPRLVWIKRTAILFIVIWKLHSPESWCEYRERSLRNRGLIWQKELFCYHRCTGKVTRIVTFQDEKHLPSFQNFITAYCGYDLVKFHRFLHVTGKHRLDLEAIINGTGQHDNKIVPSALKPWL